MNNYKDNFITIIECEYCNNIKITYITLYIISIIFVISFITNITNIMNYILTYNNNIIYWNDTIYNDVDKDDDKQFINSTDYNDELNSSIDDDISYDD